jgi:polyhydroxybutyrate depolymerase
LQPLRNLGRRAGAVVLLLGLGIATPTRGGDGLSLEHMRFASIERSYYIHLPPDYRAGGHYPLLLGLHGGDRGDGARFAEGTGFNRLADRHGFIAVYPNGINHQWNDGRGATYRVSGPELTRIDDVGYLVALIGRLEKRYAVDPRRVYVAGASNGGMMSLRLACEAAPHVAAVGGVDRQPARADLLPLPARRACAAAAHERLR